MATKEQLDLVVTAETKKAVKNIDTLNKSIGESNKEAKKSNKAFSAAQAGWLKAAGAAAAVGLALGKAFDLAETAAKFEQAAAGMERQFGVSSRKVIDHLKEMSGGTVSELGLIEAANRAMALNVTKDIDQLGSMMKLARVKARVMGIDVTQAFNDIATGVGRNSPMILDNLGIITKGWSDQAKAQGKAFDAQFILNKIQQDSAPIMKRLGELAETNAEKFQKMQANLDDAKKTIGQELLPAMVALADGLVWLLNLPAKMGKSWAKMAIEMDIAMAKLKASALNTAASIAKHLPDAMERVALIAAINANKELLAKKRAYEKITAADTVKNDLIKKGSEDTTQKVVNDEKKKADAHEAYVESIKNGIQTVNNFAASSLGELASIYSEYTDRRLENLTARQEEEMLALDMELQRELERHGLLEMTNIQKSDARIKQLQKELKSSQTEEDKNKIKEQIREAQNNKKRAKIEEEHNKKKLELEQKQKADERKIKIEAWKKEQKLKIAQTMIETPTAAMRAFSAMAGIPYVGPALGAVAAAAATGLGLAKIAMIRSAPPPAQRGALVKGVVGSEGTTVRVGENRRDEAIIPLEDEDTMERISETTGGGGSTINVYIDNFFAEDDEVPREAAVKIDAALFELKRRGESRVL